MLSTKNPKISIDKEQKPSSHVLDLADMVKKQEQLGQEEKEKHSSFFKWRTKNKKVFPKKNENDIADIEPKDEQDFGYEDKEFEDWQIKSKDKKEEKIFVSISDLAIVQFVKNLFLIFLNFFVFLKKICFRIGWIFVFILRFIYFLMLRFFKFVFSFINNKNEKIYEENYKPLEPLSPQDLVDPSLLSENDDLLRKEKEIKPEQKMYSGENQYYPPLRKETFVDNTNINNNKNHFPSLSFKISYFKTALYFAVFMLVLVLPFKAITYYSVLQDLGGRVLGVSENAVTNMKDAGSAANNLDFYEASEQFADARNNFLEAQQEINGISGQLRLLSSVIPSQKLALAANAEYMLKAGKISAQIGQEISYVFDNLFSQDDKKIKTVFNTFLTGIEPIQRDTAKLYEVLLKINVKNLPADKQELFIALRDKTGQIKNSFIELEDILDKMKIFLGFKEDKRYLLIFQNNSEMRASGGFMGSFAIVDFHDGEIVNIETPKGGTYDTEGGFLDHIVAPEPLHIVNPSWHFWDANWWPDWKKTSKKLEWFYENSGGSSVDGVIGLTPTVVERILKIIGPLDMQATHGVTITAENFWEITQTFAEQKPKNHPAYEPLPFAPGDKKIATTSSETERAGFESKKIIGDLIDKIKEELPKRLDKNMFLKLTASLEQSLSEKHVLFYFNDYLLQKKFEDLGWAGRTQKTAWDYLMVVNSNISGAKSDRKIEQEINHQAEVLSDGSIVDTLRIVRTHTGVKGEKFTGAKNLDWMRIYLPLGSQFIEAKGFWPPDQSLFEKPDPSWRHDPDLKNSEENFIRDSDSWTKIYNEGDKTVFANWVQVDPGESVEIVVKYILPFKINFHQNKPQPFALLVEKQPGAKASRISSRLLLPHNLQAEWQYPNNLKPQNNGWFVEDQLSTDKFWAVLVK